MSKEESLTTEFDCISNTIRPESTKSTPDYAIFQASSVFLNPHSILLLNNILHVKSNASQHSVRSDGALQVQRKKKNALQKARNGMLARVS